MSVSVISQSHHHGRQHSAMQYSNTANNRNPTGISLGAIQNTTGLRPSSAEMIGDADGCCLVKSFISNLLTFATRSRRKGEVNKENQANATNPSSSVQPTLKKTGVVSASSSVSAAKARKATSSETCIADSFDDTILDKLTELPHLMDRNEWLASHMLHLFDHVNSLCGTILEQCTPASCPIMSYPGAAKVSWVDERGKRHQLSAGRYIDSVMSFCEAAQKNEAIFPTKYGVSFPPDFEQHCRRTFRLLWHCLGHVYAKHWDLMALLNLRPQYGLVLAHMANIAKLFVLLDSKELNSLNSTLFLVRPPCLQAPPAKRSGGVYDHFGQSESSGAIANHTTGSAYWARVPASKSGSWGGHSTVPSMSPDSSKSSIVANKANSLDYSSAHPQIC